jgi:hypothetical protein
MNNENMISNKFGLNLERVISYIDNVNIRNDFPG